MNNRVTIDPTDATTWHSIIATAQAALEAGGIIGFPTDTVYGIGCLPNRLDAVERIYNLKQRDRTKPLILLVASVDALALLLGADGKLALAAAQAFLPGPLTIVVPNRGTVDAAVVAGARSVGLRVPAHPFCQALLAITGPLATTSANLSGGPAYAGVEEVPIPTAELFLDDGPTKQQQASSVIDFCEASPRFLREGALTRQSFVSWHSGWVRSQENISKGSA